MSKKDETETTGFPVALGEFVNGITQPETRRAFESLMKLEEGPARRTRDEWDALLVLFRSKPVGTSWKEWVSKAKVTVKEG
jgi:hypothetical protein